jgi:hypothetical protein
MNRRRPAVRPVVPFAVVSAAKAEQADAVLCMPDGVGEFFPDDVRTTCATCGRRIHHRPHVPKKPKKLCPACTVALQQGAKH